MFANLSLQFHLFLEDTLFFRYWHHMKICPCCHMAGEGCQDGSRQNTGSHDAVMSVADVE